MKVANPRICSVCGSGFSGGLKFCPVCMLRMGFKGELELEEASGEVVRSASASEAASQRFENYKVLVNEDGQPIELGRGAMGVTYKAFDVDLRVSRWRRMRFSARRSNSIKRLCGRGSHEVGASLAVKSAP